MKTSHRWLVIFGAILGALMIAVIALVLVRPGETDTLLPADTPQGTVQRFLTAYKDRNYAEAASYLNLADAGVDSPKGSPADAWRQATLNPPPEGAWKATLLHTDIYGDQAAVTVEISFFRTDAALPNPSVTSQFSFELTRQSDGWRITGLPYFWWF
jgi:hypothetical protein